MTEDDKIITDRQRIISALTAARIAKGLSQEALAARIGTKRSNICRIESGGQNITLDMLLRISAALGKDVSVILEEGKNTMDGERPHYSKKEGHVFAGLNALISKLRNSPKDDEEEEAVFTEYEWDDIQAALISILLDDHCAKADYEKAAGIIWDAALAGKGINIDLIVGLLYYRLGDRDAPYDNNLIWSIAAQLKSLDYANSDYDPYKDEAISKELNEYGICLA